MKQPRLPAAFSSRSSASEKKGHTILTNSVGAYSSSANNSTGPGGGGAAPTNNQTSDLCEQTNVVATLASHTSTATPIASLALPPPGKSHLMNATPSASSSSSSAAKRFLIQRVRSQSRSDAQSVPDKSLFSRFFPKKTKKTPGTLITTSAAKSMDLDISNTRAHLMHQSSLSSNDPRLPIGEGGEFDEDDEFDERIISTGSLSDHHRLKEDGIHATRSSTTSRTGSRTNSSSDKQSASHRNPANLLGSDSAYYVSMSSAPKGISISYHKCLNRGNDNLRKQAVLGRFQQQSKEAEGANPLMVCSTGCTATFRLSLLGMTFFSSPSSRSSYSILAFIVSFNILPNLAEVQARASASIRRRRRRRKKEEKFVRK